MASCQDAKAMAFPGSRTSSSGLCMRSSASSDCSLATLGVKCPPQARALVCPGVNLWELIHTVSLTGFIITEEIVEVQLWGYIWRHLQMGLTRGRKSPMNMDSPSPWAEGQRGNQLSTVISFSLRPRFHLCQCCSHHEALPMGPSDPGPNPVKPWPETSLPHFSYFCLVFCNKNARGNRHRRSQLQLHVPDLASSEAVLAVEVPPPSHSAL